MPERQTRAQAETMRNAFAACDARSRMKDLATKGDLREVELRFENRIESGKRETLKWAIGTIITRIALTAAVIGMAVAILLK